MPPLLEQTLRLVAPEFRQEFLSFVEIGEASPDFLAYLDSDEDCQDALEEALTPETELIRLAIDRIRREVRERGSIETAPVRHQDDHWN